jgi:putative membrane protein
MRKAVLGALVATAVALGMMATPAAAHEGHDGERGRSERVDSRRGERGDRDSHRDKDRRSHHRDRHHDGHRGDRGGWDRGGWDRDEALSAEDRAFVELAAQIGLTEIFQGHLALSRSTDPVVQDYGRQMVVDHLHQMADQLPIHRKYDLELPSLTEDQAAAVQALIDTPVEQFDVAYLTSQVVAHEQALALFTAQAEDGDNWKVRKFARSYVPALQHHLDLAEAALATQVTPAA